MRNLAALVAGLLFGLGLVVSGMVNPAKVIGFLDVTGNWDPSLMFVMASALAITALGYRLVFGRAQPVCETEFHIPANKAIDGRLIAGAGIFGIGWGMGGFCPGPGISALGMGQVEAVAFVASMLFGMWLKVRLFGAH